MTLSENAAKLSDTATEALPRPVRNGIPAGSWEIMGLAALLLIPAISGAWLLADVSMAVAVLGGGMVALANFWLLSRIVVKATSGPINGSQLLGRMLSKFLLLVISLGVVVLLLRLNALGVLLGVGTIFPAIILGSLMDLFRDRHAPQGVTN